MIKILDDSLFTNVDIIFINKDSNNATFVSGKIGILSVGLGKINFDDVNFDEDDSETIIHIRFMACCASIYVKQRNNVKYLKYL